MRKTARSRDWQNLFSPKYSCGGDYEQNGGCDTGERFREACHEELCDHSAMRAPKDGRLAIRPAVVHFCTDF